MDARRSRGGGIHARGEVDMEGSLRRQPWSRGGALASIHQGNGEELVRKGQNRNECTWPRWLSEMQGDSPIFERTLRH
jgi:hypothetical protein